MRHRIKTVAVLAVPILAPMTSHTGTKLGKTESPATLALKRAPSLSRVPSVTDKAASVTASTSQVPDCEPAEAESDEEGDDEDDDDLIVATGASQPIAVVVLTNRLDDKGKEFVGLPPPAAPGALPLPAAALTEHASRRLIDAHAGKTFHTRKESKAWKLHGDDRMLKGLSPHDPHKKVLRVTAFTPRDLDLVTNLALAAAASLDVTA